MRYRVQYALNDQRRTEEVEAGSPQEAVLKFRMSRPDHHDARSARWQVLSVTLEAVCEEMRW